MIFIDLLDIMCWDYSAIITSNSNLDIAQRQARECLRNCTIGVLQLSYRSTVIKQILCCSMWKTNRFLKNCICIQTDVMQITRIKYVQYLGMSLDENLYYHDHVNRLCALLVKYFGIFNHIKNLVSLRISKQLYYASFILGYNTV